MCLVTHCARDHSGCPVWFQLALVNYTQSLKLHPIDSPTLFSPSVCVCVKPNCWRHLPALFPMSALIRLNEVQLFLCFRHLGEAKWKYSCLACARVFVCRRKLLCGVWRWVRKTGCQLVNTSFHLSNSSKESSKGQNWDGGAASLPVSAPDVSYCWTRIMAITTVGQH